MNNVIDFVSRKKLISVKEKEQENEKKNTSLTNFEKVHQMNLENSERLKKEREIANRNVIKSYRIK